MATRNPPSTPPIDARRTFLRTALSTAGATLVGCATAATARPAHAEPSEPNEAEVTPGEDLMQEHGLLARVMLVYDEAARRIEAGEPLDPAGVASAAAIVRSFVEDYHERNEERFVFPRLSSAGRETALVATLLRQHQRGRELTEDIRSRARARATPELARAMRSFVHMYRPHAAREDTVLFPAFRSVLGRAGYRELGERLEEEEHRLFGEHGFERTVADVARIEASLGIADLASFTP